MDESVEILLDLNGLQIRMTAERMEHLLAHPEMVGQLERIRQTLAEPECIVLTHADESVHVYHRFYEKTPVTSKYLYVVVKVNNEDSFVLTAFFSSRRKRGTTLWQK